MGSFLVDNYFFVVLFYNKKYTYIIYIHEVRW